MGKKKFGELPGGLPYNPKGRPVLAADDGRCPKYSSITINGFNERRQNYVETDRSSYRQEHAFQLSERK